MIGERCEIGIWDCKFGTSIGLEVNWNRVVNRLLELKPLYFVLMQKMKFMIIMHN